MVFSFFFAIFANSMLDDYKTNKSRVQQFGLTATIKDDSGKEHYFHNGYEYVEIGGLKWAVTNIGANTEIDSGLYFAFGEPKGYTADQVRNGERKFNEKEYTDANFDAVNAYLGGNWRLPTAAEFQSLLSLATNKWVENYEGSGVSGRLFADKTDSSKKLFFPTAGFCFYNSMEYVDCYGFYWSSSLLGHDVSSGIDFNFGRGYSSMLSDKRYFGFSVRGVFA